MRRRKLRPKARLKLRVALRRHWNNPTFKNRMVKTLMKACGIKPNRKEQLLGQWLQRWFPDKFRYVGAGEIIIGGRCPDYIYEEEKKIIELFGDYWHSNAVTGREISDEVDLKLSHFKKYGYETLIIWEHELENLDQVYYRIKEFLDGDSKRKEVN